MTIRVYVSFLERIAVLLKMEMGEEEKTSLTGNNAMNLGKRIFPRGRGWQV